MRAMTRRPCNLDVEKLKPLVNDPKYIRKACGRVANEEKNIRQPDPIK